MAEPRAFCHHLLTLIVELRDAREQLRRERDEARDCCQTSTEVALNEAQQRLESEIERDALRELLRECRAGLEAIRESSPTVSLGFIADTVRRMIARIEEVMPDGQHPNPVGASTSAVTGERASVQHAQEREARDAAAPDGDASGVRSVVPAQPGVATGTSAPTPSDSDRQRAGALLARWRTEWGKWIEHWERFAPDKPGPDTPGVVTRLALADDVAAEFAAVRRETRLQDAERLAASLKEPGFLEWDRKDQEQHDAAVRAEGFRAGLEAAAQECDQIIRETDTSPTIDEGCDSAEVCAARIRALAERSHG